MQTLQERNRMSASQQALRGCLLLCALVVVLLGSSLPGCYAPFLPKPEPKSMERPAPPRELSPQELPSRLESPGTDASGPELPFEGAASCPTPQPARCGDQCVDLFASPEHCGGCFQACPTTALCQGGQCTCPSGQIVCAGLCVDPNANVYHCGGCDIQCPLGQRCTGGLCLLTCINPGETICQGQCVVLTSDQDNCGACGVQCPAGKSCVSGACKDNQNCTTSVDCPNGQICSGGKCIPCHTDADCGASKVCLRGVCRNIPCQHAPECPTGQLCISGSCAGCKQTSQCPQVPGKVYSKTISKSLPSGARVDFLFQGIPPSSGKITVTLTLKGDYGGDSEYITLLIDGKNYGKVDPNTENSYVKTLSIGAQYASDGKLLVRITNTDAVDDAAGSVRLRYTSLEQQSCQSGRCQ